MERTHTVPEERRIFIEEKSRRKILQANHDRIQARWYEKDEEHLRKNHQGGREERIRNQEADGPRNQCVRKSDCGRMVRYMAEDL